MCGKGSQTTTNQTSSSADPQAAQAYRDLLSRAQGVASTPYQAYTGELTAPVNAQQTAGISGINSNANFASPYIQQAAGQASASSAPLTAGRIQQYQSPYTQSVVDATQAQINHNNAVQQNQLQGNQIAQGALGGNRAGVASASLAGQQALANNSTIAGLYNQSYQQALQAAQGQQGVGLQGANAIANYGISGQGAALSGAGAQLGAGTLQQQTQQQANTANYGQYAQGQAFPYQQTQWLAGLDTGVGSNLGGTSSGSTTAPAPNQTAQWVGAGLSAAALLSDRRAKEDVARVGKLNDGTPIYRYRYKGSPQWHVGPMAQDLERSHPDSVGEGVSGLKYVDLKSATDDSVRRASGGGVSGSPWGDAQGWIPAIGIHGGSGAPHSSAPSLSQTPAFDPSKFAQGLSGKGVSGGTNSLAYGSAVPGAEGATSVGGSPLVPSYNFTGLGAYASGGGVAGYAGGGTPSYDDLINGDPSWANPDIGPGVVPPLSFNERAEPVRRAMETGDFDPRGANSTEFRGTPGMEVANAGAVPTPIARPAGAGAPVVASDDEDDAAPPAVRGVAGGPPSGAGVAAFAPEGPSSYRSMPDAIRGPDERGGFGLLPISPNASSGLLAAGLGMLASRSPNLGNAIGEGGIAGVAAYGSANEADRKAAAEAEKLSREAWKTSEDLKLRSGTQQEMARHNRATEKNAAADKVPAGYERTKDGLRALPGGPADPDEVSKLTAAKTKPKGDLMDDETAQLLADRVRAGDTRALIGLGRGAQGAENIAKIQGIVARDAKAGAEVAPAARSILSNAANHAGLLTAERTQAAIMAKLSVYGRTAFNATDIVEKLSDAVPRTEFQPVNKIFNAYRTNTGDPKIVALGQGLMTLTNEYARAIGGGHGTVHDKEAAEARLSAAQSPDQLRAVINVMRQEIVAAENAMPAARQHIRDIYNPSGAPKGGSVASSHAPATGGFAPPAGAIPREFNGKTYYYDPNTKQPYPGQQ